jgi:hypothetical protein
MKNAKIDSNKLLEKLQGKLSEHSYHLVWEAVIDMICGAHTCVNTARCTSGYCGICDLTLNDGKGERR